MRYLILTATSIQKLEEIVTDHINSGWTINSSPVIIFEGIFNNEPKYRYFQSTTYRS